MRVLKAIRDRPWALVLLGVVLMAGMGGGGVYAYRLYDFVEHDNDFCMSCHLMAKPFELFGESAHRGLGCKACHQPTLVARSQMALTQVVENPEELETHADVPDERCVTCHVEGDPEKWRSIAESAGHRIHLESADSTLADVQCVGCHSSGVHEFAAVDKTCGQAGCHEDSSISLGEMSDLTIHCAACHSFSAPVDESSGLEAVQAALTPASGECLSCHVMRTLVDMPPDDPHEGLCASCHNPHEQSTPEEAVESCAVGGCHDDPAGLTDYHLGLDEQILADCSSCHTAHDFHAEGADCVACHEDVLADPGTPFRTGSLVGGRGAGRPVSFTYTVSGPAVWPAGGPVGSIEPVPADSVLFRHSEHRELDCLSCHATDESHGRVTVTTVSDCRSCHHAEPESADCVSCHEDAGRFAPLDTVRVHDMAFEIGRPVGRALPFEHGPHASEDCSTCHADAGGLTLSAGSVSCSSCHEPHHAPEVACLRCHLEASEADHPVEEVHVTCSGSGCHAPSAFDAVPRTRQFCLTCHQDLVEHRIEDDRDCAACHTLPEPRNPPGGGG